MFYGKFPLESFLRLRYKVTDFSTGESAIFTIKMTPDVSASRFAVTLENKYQYIHLSFLIVRGTGKHLSNFYVAFDDSFDVLWKIST